MPLLGSQFIYLINKSLSLLLILSFLLNFLIGNKENLLTLLQNRMLHT